MPKTEPTQPLVWLLMGRTTGDNNQLLALVEALGYPFEQKRISYNQLRRLSALRTGLTIVTRQSRELIRPPWPDLVVGVGYGSVPIARYIRQQTGGRAKLVHVGNPRGRLDDFDLQITTPQYSRAAAPNMVELLFPIGNPAKNADPTSAELDWLRAYRRPRRLVAIGGPARHWKLDHRTLVEAIRSIGSKEPAGSVLAATSARTSTRTRRLIANLMTGTNQAMVEEFPRFAVLLQHCDEIYVTADSVSMISEAILTGKPTGLIPIERSLRGLVTYWAWERPFGGRTFPDFQNFWGLLHRAGFAGTVELPVASQVCDTVERAADAVRSLFAPGDSIDERKAAAPHLGDDRGSAGRQRPGDRARGGDRPAVRNQTTRI